jgi:hypothetical protein
MSLKIIPLRLGLNAFGDHDILRLFPMLIMALMMDESSELVDADADAAIDVQISSVNGVHRVQREEYFSCTSGRIARISEFRKQHHEFISALAANGIRTAEAGLIRAHSVDCFCGIYDRALRANIHAPYELAESPSLSCLPSA